MEVFELLLTAGRTVVVYLLVLLVVRVLGRREIGTFSPLDFLVAVMLGAVVDEMIYGTVTLLQGATATLTIAGLRLLTGWLCYLNEPADLMLNGRPTIVVEHGELRPAGMRRERVTREQIMEQLRLVGVEDIREVRFVIVEATGQISVVLEDWARPLRKCDLDPSADQERHQSLQKEGELPPPDKDPLSPDSLPAERV